MSAGVLVAGAARAQAGAIALAPNAFTTRAQSVAFNYIGTAREGALRLAGTL